MKVPIIVEIRDFWPEVFFYSGIIKEESFLGKLLLKGERWIYKNADSIIFLKKGDRNYLSEKKWDVINGGNIEQQKCYYINNGVDLKKFDEQVKLYDYKDNDLDSKKFNIVYTGSIRTVNNLDFIIDTAKLLNEFTNIQFIIFGEGDQVDRLNERIINESIKNVKMKGYVSKKYIPSILSKSNLNILNYSRDKYNWTRGNSSNKLFEYMASGKPILSTIQFGYSQIEDYRCGVSLKGNTEQEMASIIQTLYKMSPIEQIEMGKRARLGAEDYDYDELYKKLLNVFEKLQIS